MAWIILFVAGLLEVGWAIGLKYTDGFTRVWPTVGTAAAMVVSLILLYIIDRRLTGLNQIQTTLNAMKSDLQEFIRRHDAWLWGRIERGDDRPPPDEKRHN